MGRIGRSGKTIILALVALLVASAADAQQQRQQRRQKKEPDRPAQQAPADRRDRLVAAPGTPFNGRPYWQVLAQCGGIYFKLNTLYANAAIHARVVKPDRDANAKYSKSSDQARRTATAYFEASERFLVADRGMNREEAMLTFDARATQEGDRHKSIDIAEQATKPCPALYQTCRDVVPKLCSEAALAANLPESRGDLRVEEESARAKKRDKK